MKKKSTSGVLFQEALRTHGYFSISIEFLPSLIHFHKGSCFLSKERVYVLAISCLWIGLGPLSLFAQPLPPLQPEQDCIGALPICQTSILQPNAYIGEGLNPSEVTPTISCLNGGENNGHWYTLTTQDSGVLAFSLIPLASVDDYDWAVYNLTNANCGDIATNPTLEVRCNWSGIGGTTGANGLPGPTNEAPIPVIAGETYAIYISNWSGTGNGFTLDFSASTTGISDTIAPTLDSAQVVCGSDDVNVWFSESLLCSTVDSLDFTLTGPGGPFMVSAVSGIDCALGGIVEANFQISTIPPISLPGTYTLSLVDTVTDFCGNVASLSSTSFFIDPNAPVVDLVLTPTIIPTNCDGIGGSIGLNITGGTAPYTFDWNTGSQDSVIAGIMPGGYSVLVSDTNQCTKQAVYFLEYPDSCFVSVSGTAYYDLNGNCVQDSNESGIPYLYIDLSPGSATFTDANGHYAVELDTGQINIQVPTQGSYFSPICPANAQHLLNLTSFDADTSGLDFAMDMVMVQDLRIVGSFLTWANPGFLYTYYIQAYNDGSMPMDATVTWQYDSLLSFSYSSVTPDSHDTMNRILTWHLDSLLPGHSFGAWVSGITDASAGIGSLLLSTSTVTPIQGDSTPGNNVFVDSSFTVGSFDPNDKSVSPTGFGDRGFIQAHEKEMLYTIRFQNTGNYPAQYVVIRDTIHVNLDLSSYQAMTHSHPYTLDVEEDSILIFTFADIQLPDSASDLDDSQGFVQFKLIHEGTLSLGDQISNSAAIYFDFNDPIITNEVLNTIYSPMSLDFLHDDPFCPGDSLVGMLAETGLAPFRYQWSSGLQDSNQMAIMYPIEVSASGLYSLTVEDALGIRVTDSVNITVESLPIAHAGLDIQGLVISLTDSSSFAESWLWDFGDGNTSSEVSPSHSFANSGDYQVRLIVSNVCGEDTTVFDISLTTSVADLFAASVEVVPNPFSEQCIIRFDHSDQTPLSLVVMDTRGKVVRRISHIRTGQVILHRADLSRGMYLFHLSGEEKNYSGKLLIK
ncbi:MAG: PKD domain-containing protein [Bacteroidota bacterium]